MKKKFLAGIALVASCAASAHVYKIEPNWTWCQEYLHLWSEYTLICQDGRRCEVGYGVFVNGEPLGGRAQFVGTLNLTVYGVGALHVRMIDGKGPGTVELLENGAKPVTVISVPLGGDNKTKYRTEPLK